MHAAVVPSAPRHSHYGAVSDAQKTCAPRSQNNRSPLLSPSYESFSAETSQRNFDQAARKSFIMRTFVVLLALALCVAVAMSAVWEGENGLVVPSLNMNLREEMISVDETRPTQIHLALYDETAKRDARHVGMTVSWATIKPTKQSVVRFGRSASEMNSAATAAEPCRQYHFCDYKSPFLHHVVIDGSLLEPDTTYFYQCGDPASWWSEIRTFTTPTAIGDPKRTTFAVIGDLGQTQYSEQTIRHLANETQISAILHAGDISYADSDQPRWDRWGMLVEPLSSTRAWMVSAGNHEAERPCQQDVDHFVAYQERFRMPFDSHDSSQQKNLYFGFRTGLVHFIILTPYISTNSTSPQYQWLEAELGRVNRSLTPWVVVMMHGPWYNSNTAHQGHEPHIAMKEHMEDLLFEHKVDLVYSGHVHAYERSYAVYKEQVRPDGTVYIVLGDGGNREGLAPTYIQPTPAWSAFRLANYGFGLFHVINRTHAEIAMYEDQEKGNAILQDSATLTTTHFRVATGSVSHILP